MYSPSRGHNHSSQHRGNSSWTPGNRAGRASMPGPPRHHTPTGARPRPYHDLSYTRSPHNNGSPYGPPRHNHSPYGPPGHTPSPYRPRGQSHSPYGLQGSNHSSYGPQGSNQSPYGPQGPNQSPYGPQGSNQSPHGPSRQSTPRHSTPFYRGGNRGRQSLGGSMSEFFTPQQSPMQASANDSSYFTAPEDSRSNADSYRGQGRGRGRGRPFRRHYDEGQSSMYGKRQRTNETLPGTLLKTSMMDDPWSEIVPMKSPEDGLVLSGGQRHSVLTGSKATAIASAEKTEDVDASGEIDLTD